MPKSYSSWVIWTVWSVYMGTYWTDISCWDCLENCTDISHPWGCICTLTYSWYLCVWSILTSLCSTRNTFILASFNIIDWPMLTSLLFFALMPMLISWFLALIPILTSYISFIGSIWIEISCLSNMLNYDIVYVPKRLINDLSPKIDYAWIEMSLKLLDWNEDYD